MSLFDWLDYGLVTALYAAAFWFGGVRWRWIATISFLAANLIFARVIIAGLESPIQALALVHAGFALLLLAYSQTNYGRMIGLCFLSMLALDGLCIAGILSPEYQPGLHWNFWNYISALQHAQTVTLITCFWRHRYASWKTV